MILNFALWSPLISLIAASFLYPLRLHYRGQNVCQVYSGIIILPALVSSLYLFFITRNGGVVTSRNIDVRLTPIGLGSHVASLESFFLVAICFSILMVVFFGQKAKLAENLLYTCSGFSFLIVFLILPNQIVRTSFFCIASLITSLFLINRTPEISSPLIVRDFFWQRLGDILAICALFMTINQTAFDGTNIHRSAIFLNLAVLTRIVSVALFRPINGSIIHVYMSEELFRKIILGVGSISLIINNFNTKLDEELGVIFSSISIAVLALIVSLNFFSKNRVESISNGFNALIIATLIAHYLQWIELAIGLLGVFIVVGPLTLQESTRDYIPDQKITSKREFSGMFLWFLSIISFFRFIVARSCMILARTFTNIISPIYSGFCFYYLPMILIGLLQIPLRIFYNGNVQRSLIFAVFLIGTYIFLWVK